MIRQSLSTLSLSLARTRNLAEEASSHWTLDRREILGRSAFAKVDRRKRVFHQLRTDGTQKI